MPRDPRDKTGRARLAAHERDSFDIQPGMSIGGGSFSGTGGGSALVDEYGQQMTPRDDYVSFLEQELNRLRGQASQVMARPRTRALARLSHARPSALFCWRTAGVTSGARTHAVSVCFVTSCPLVASCRFPVDRTICIVWRCAFPRHTADGAR